MKVLKMVMVVKAAVMKDTIRRRDSFAKQIGVEEAVYQFTPTFSATNVTNMVTMRKIVIPTNVTIVAEGQFAKYCRANKKVEETINLALDDATCGSILLMAQNKEPNTKGDDSAKEDGGSLEVVEIVRNEVIRSGFGEIAVFETRKSKKESGLNTQSANEPKKLPDHQKENRDLEQQPKSAVDKSVEKSLLQTLKSLNEHLLNDKVEIGKEKNTFRK